MNKICIRNILLTVILILLVILVILFRNRSPFGKGTSDFTSEPDKEITRIELYEGSKKVVLTLEEKGWMADGSKEVRKSAIMFIVSVLTEMKIKSPVSPEMFDSDIISKEIEPVSVRVYERRRLLRSFLVYKTTSNRYGNIMKMKERANPFIVYVPGYEGDIGLVFDAARLFWLPYTVFNVLPSEISSVSFENYSDTASSFNIKNTGGKYQLSDMKNSLTGWDSSRVSRYITYFTLVPFESWASDISETEKQRLASENPVFTITVRKSDGRSIHLNLWERYTDGKKDTDRLWGKTDDIGDFFIMRYFDIDPLLKKIDYFFPE